MNFTRNMMHALLAPALLFAFAAISENAAAQSSTPKDPITTQAISIPKGEGSIEGMGESFSAQPSTGIATFRVPVQLPKARGTAQPSLAMAYSSASGAGLLGVGWSLGVPYISRQTDRGNPKYNDPPAGMYSADQDRFVFGGGQELVPLGVVQGGRCQAAPGETFPSWADGWQYFRPRIEGAFLRFFWSPDRRTWRVFDKGGASMELGVPLDGSGSTNALDTSPEDTSKIFSWNIARAYDNEGTTAPLSQAAPTPVNVVVYRYAQIDGISYLSDTYDTPPAANPSAPLSSFAHHVHLVYGPRTDAMSSYRRGWLARTTQRLTRIDVSSQTASGIGTRELVRRYVLAYAPNQRMSLLASVTAEGRCASPIQEQTNGELPYAQSCPGLPPMRFDYTQGGRPGTTPKSFLDLGSFDSTVVQLGNGPTIPLSDTQTDFLDVNADALPDVFRTYAAGGGGGYSVWFNSAGGTASSFGSLTPMSVQPPENASLFELNRTTTVPLDLDGNAIVDLLFLPNSANSYIASPVRAGTAWQWLVRSMTTPSDGNTFLNMSGQSANVRVMDVNGDGLVDIVRTTTEMQTFFNLGRYPGGDARFGVASRSSATSSNIVKAPARACLPGDNMQVQFSDREIYSADMNGDGLIDLVRMKPGAIEYWPGHGDGWWGVVPPPGCAGTTRPPGARGEIKMANSPQFTPSASSQQRLVDVNGDALVDLVDVRREQVLVYFNLGGTGFTSTAFQVGSTPDASGFVVRVVDVNGSGSPDVVWGRGGDYRYLDVLGGVRPNLLSHIENGLGQTTDITYASSTSMMLEAERAGKPWSSVMPIETQMVAKVVTSDNLALVGRPAVMHETSYTYRDPAWDGQQREFRGFRQVTTRVLGDASSPTSMTSTSFLTGDCADETNDGVDDCGSPERWRDNRREALKGLPVASETYDDNGVYLATNHTTYTLRHLYTGLDGRAVRHVFPSGGDAWAYDTHDFVANASPLSVTDVVLDGSAAGPAPTTALTLRSSRGRAHMQTLRTVDTVGNVTAETSLGCIDGCSQVDEAITTRTDFDVAPGDTSGWLYRPVRGWVEGSQTPRRNEHLVEYDDRGRARATRAVVSGTLPLDRFHEDPTKSVAPAPSGASTDGIILVAAQQYDAFGNVTFQTSPNHRCRKTAFETDFAQFPIAETVFVGAVNGECGATALTAYAAYDRGLAAPVNIIDLHGELSTFTYDGLGRLVAMRHPSPTQIGATSPVDSLKIQYFLPSDSKATPYSLMHTRTQDGASDGDASYRDTWAFVNGLGQPIVMLEEADPSAGDGGQWVVSDQTESDNKGAVRRAYEPWFWTGDPKAFPLTAAPNARFTQQAHDAFGRPVQNYALDGTLVSRVDYHARSIDTWDVEDLGSGPHAGTYGSVRTDGHGRSIATTERIRTGNGLEVHDVQTTYLATGESASVRRVHVGGTAAPVVRTMQYDSLGRMVLNVEPNTSKATDAGGVKAWRYAYNDSGNVVGFSDARGCGANSHYDAGGRLVADDYSPCLGSQADYSAPNLATGDGTESYHHYDTADPNAPTVVDDCAIRTDLLLGRLVSSSDRASRILSSFDGRGRITCETRQVAKPGSPSGILSERYAPGWYTKTAAYDGANRTTQASTGAKVTELLGEEGKSFVSTAYTARGLVKNVGGSYGALLSDVTHDADGLTMHIGYADAAATKTDVSYDVLRRRRSVQTYRGPSPLWSQTPAPYSPAPNPNGPPTSFQLLLEDVDYSYDQIGNPTKIQDHRVSSDWPEGAKPVSRTMQYDDLYRITRTDYQYEGGSDLWVSPFASEDSGGRDPRRATPTPRLGFPKRVLSETFQYDWLGNTIQTTDDTGAFFDRSLGTITNGTATAGPYQLKSAAGGAAPRDGLLTAQYDDAGNMVGLSIERSASAPCLPAGSNCSQRFAYEWDEVGQLARARRWDGANLGAASGPLPMSAPNVELKYAYDATGNRVLKAASSGNGDSYTVYAFDSLELRRAEWNGTDYDRTRWTEVPYLSARGKRVARVHYADTSVPTLTSGQLHVLLELPDHLGSSSIVIDKGTGELVERSTYQTYGSSESDYRPDRWGAFREDYRFTGKEDDIEVGLAYFGARYYVTTLGRWASADPLAIHALGSDLNAYAFVAGSPQNLVDPNGMLFCLACWDNFVGGTGPGGPTGWGQPAGGNAFWAEGTKNVDANGQPAVPGMPSFKKTTLGIDKNGKAHLVPDGWALKRTTVPNPDRKAPNDGDAHVYKKIVWQLVKAELCGPMSSCQRVSNFLVDRWNRSFSNREAFGEYLQSVGGSTTDAAKVVAALTALLETRNPRAARFAVTVTGEVVVVVDAAAVAAVAAVPALLAAAKKSNEGRAADGRKNFQDARDAQEQIEDLEQAQAENRARDQPNKIESTGRSGQRFKYFLKQLRKWRHSLEDYGEADED